MSESATTRLPVFYACVPEAPGGPPFEIAWGTSALDPNKSHGVVCESHLIRPPAAWILELARDPSALQTRGLAIADLRQFGAPVRELAARMNAALAERELFSATLADDDRVKRLFDAASSEPKFALRKCDAEELIAELAWLRRLPPVAVARAKREAEVRCLTCLRAEAKVRYLVTYWRLIAGVN